MLPVKRMVAPFVAAVHNESFASHERCGGNDEDSAIMRIEMLRSSLRSVVVRMAPAGRALPAG